MVFFAQWFLDVLRLQYSCEWVNPQKTNQKHLVTTICTLTLCFGRCFIRVHIGNVWVCGWVKEIIIGQKTATNCILEALGAQLGGGGDDWEILKNLRGTAEKTKPLSFKSPNVEENFRHFSPGSKQSPLLAERRLGIVFL